MHAEVAEVALDLGTLQVQVLFESVCPAALLHLLGACLLQGSFCYQPLRLHHAHLDHNSSSSPFSSIHVH